MSCKHFWHNGLIIRDPNNDIQEAIGVVRVCRKCGYTEHQPLSNDAPGEWYEEGAYNAVPDNNLHQHYEKQVDLHKKRVACSTMISNGWVPKYFKKIGFLQAVK